MNKQNVQECPCVFDPIVMNCPERICSTYIYVEQPIILHHTMKKINHYIPKPIYYHTFSQSEENVCHGNK
jgi:hypothetical protein